MTTASSSIKPVPDPEVQPQPGQMIRFSWVEHGIVVRAATNGEGESGYVVRRYAASGDPYQSWVEGWRVEKVIPDATPDATPDA